MEIKKLHVGEARDFAELIGIFRTVFELNIAIPGEPHLTKLLALPDFMVFVAKSGAKVVGGLTVYVLHQYYSQKPLAYIYDVGVAPEFQRKGIGKTLIEYVCNFCKENGFEDAYVEAEQEDVDAVRFYRQTAFSDETAAIHFTYSLAGENG